MHCPNFILLLHLGVYVGFWFLQFVPFFFSLSIVIYSFPISFRIFLQIFLIYLLINIYILILILHLHWWCSCRIKNFILSIWKNCFAIVLRVSSRKYSFAIVFKRFQSWWVGKKWNILEWNGTILTVILHLHFSRENVW